MATMRIDALSAESVLETNALATVMSNWIVVPDAEEHSQTILALSRLKDVKIVKFTYPGLLVIAAALFLLAAAAYCSHQGEGASIPMAIAGLLFVGGYLGTRRAAVAFSTTSSPEITHTMQGSPGEAAELAQAVQLARVTLNDSMSA